MKFRGYDKIGCLGTLNLLHQVFGLQYKGENFVEIYTYIVSFGNELFPSCTEWFITYNIHITRQLSPIFLLCWYYGRLATICITVHAGFQQANQW